MLAPDDIDPIMNALKTFYTQVCAGQQLDTVAGSAQIYAVKKESQWIIHLRQEMELLRKSVYGWPNVKQTTIAQTLSPFLQYYNKFCSVACFLPQADSGEMAATLVDRLLTDAEKHMANTRKSCTQFEDWTKSALLHVTPLQERVQEAWQELGASEHKIVSLSNRIVQLENDIAALDGVLGMDKIMTGGKDIAVGVANITYGFVMGSASVPYMTFAKMFFTLGKMLYDIFSTADALHKKLNSLQQYSLDLTLEQQALAQTKAALMFVYDLKSMMERQQTVLPQIEEFWRQEVRTLRAVRTDFALEKDFSPNHPEIMQLPIAQSVWFSLKDAANGLVNRFQLPVDDSTKIAILT